MRVIATAGHVDHGKSTLVTALTGTDPDRWAEEHRRGLTIDLGYVWTTLPDTIDGAPIPGGGERIAFVDVPGHQRFIANMLAGVGPAPAVMFAVAADEGWCRQSTEHLEAVKALGITRGLLVITRSDLTNPANATAEAKAQLASTGLGGCETVAVSAVTGKGMDRLKAALGRLVTSLPEPDVEARVRLWIDRVFTVKGAGTVVTGTLGSGTLAGDDRVTLHTSTGLVEATIRGLQSMEQPHPSIPAVARVAVNLRGTPAETLARGDALVTGTWHTTASVDATCDRDVQLPEYLMAHVGTAAMQVRVRPLSGRAVRLTWTRPLPLQVGDRLILRDPGQQHVVCGVQVVDVDPPELNRRGAARRRGDEVATSRTELDVVAEVARRGWMRQADLLALGADDRAIAHAVEQGLMRSDATSRTPRTILASPGQWQAWADRLAEVTDRAITENPLQARLSLGAAARDAQLPEASLATVLAGDAGLEVKDGHLGRPGVRATLGTDEAALVEIEHRLAVNPFDVPDREALAASGLGPKQLAAAVRTGRLIDLGDQVFMAPLGPARAMRVLAELPQPFTTSEARQALETSRRVVIPLLEHLDAKGWTRRIDAGHREVVRAR